MRSRSTLFAISLGGLTFVCLYVLLAQQRSAGNLDRSTTAELRRYETNANEVRRATFLSLVSQRDRLASLIKDVEMMSSSHVDGEPDYGSPTARDVEDREWLTFPRTKFFLPQVLASRAKTLAARDLFRNTHLNPNDKYISKFARQTLALVVASYSDLVGQALDVETTVIRTEIAALVELGRAQGVPYDNMRIPRILEENADDALRTHLNAVMERHALDPKRSHLIVPEMVFGTGERPYAMHCDGGMMFGARLCELPMTQDAVAIKHHITMELASAIVSFFRGLQVLSQDEGDRILVRCAEHLEASKTGSSPGSG